MTRPGGPGFLRFGLLFGAGLAAGATLVGRLIGVDPWADLAGRPGGFALGALAALPILPLLPLSELRSIGPLRRIRELLDRAVLPLLRGVPVAGLLALAVSAGVGEEVLFRGLVQRGLSGPLGPGPALAAASVVFGVLHAATPTYGLLAAAMGAYFGVLYEATGDLTVPVVAHSAYDFAALVYFTRAGPAGTMGADARGEE